ncbi:uncharacterized protein LOC119662368 [Teleopsis dalmanni]|uniref:uncharacterized protein LOC119662368 n=1 Tax=Teleopsis dalmanni TaxID=139649 RepID=UPI0018CCBA9A|nr:uncharacterized protein LOC119662368 [Teleopsis dalmanni]
MEYDGNSFNTHKIIVFKLLSKLIDKWNQFNKLRMEYAIKLCDLKNKTGILMSKFSTIQDNSTDNIEIDILSDEIEDIKRHHAEINLFFSSHKEKVIDDAKELVLYLIMEKNKVMKIYNEILLNEKRNILPDRTHNSEQYYLRPIVETQVCFFIYIRRIRKIEEKLIPFFKILCMNGINIISPAGCLPLWLHSARGTENVENFIDSSYDETYYFSRSCGFKDGDSTRDNICDNVNDSTND